MMQLKIIQFENVFMQNISHTCFLGLTIILTKYIERPLIELF